MHFMLYFLISVIIIILSLIWLIKLWPSEENFEETKYLQTKDDMTTVVDCETYVSQLIKLIRMDILMMFFQMPSTSCENLPTPTTSKMDLYNTPRYDSSMLFLQQRKFLVATFQRIIMLNCVQIFLTCFLAIQFIPIRSLLMYLLSNVSDEPSKTFNFQFPTRYSPQPSSNGSSVGKLSPPREFSVEKQKLDLDEDEDVETIGDEVFFLLSTNAGKG
jgi:hypothetical protein